MKPHETMSSVGEPFSNLRFHPALTADGPSRQSQMGTMEIAELPENAKVKAQIRGWKKPYEGRIEKENEDGSCKVIFDDGEIIEQLQRNEILEILPEKYNHEHIHSEESNLETIPPKSRVKAQIRGWKKPYEGRIEKENEDGSFKVIFDDGEIIEQLQRNEILKVFATEDELHLDKENSRKFDAKDLKPGVRVAAKVANWKRAYEGVVKRRNIQTGTFKIVFDDGEVVNNVQLDQILELLHEVGKESQDSFEAPDGATFHEKEAYRDYMYTKFLSFKDREGEHDLVKEPNSLNGQPFDLHSLTHCTVKVLCWTSQVQVDELLNCKVFIGPCESSVFIRDCRNCEFTVACKQLRVRDCRDVTFHLFSMTDPVIETSTDLTFTPFNGAYTGLAEDFKKARLDPNDNHWRHIFDFNQDGCDGFGIPDPHFELVEKTEVFVVEEFGECSNPVPLDAKAITVSDGGSMHANQQTCKVQDVRSICEGDHDQGLVFQWLAQEVDVNKAKVGSIVKVNFNRGSKDPKSADFYQGQVSSINYDGTFSIEYDDGDREENCKADFIKLGVVVNESRSPIEADSESEECSKESHSNETRKESETCESDQCNSEKMRSSKMHSQFPVMSLKSPSCRVAKPDDALKGESIAAVRGEDEIHLLRMELEVMREQQRIDQQEMRSQRRELETRISEEKKSLNKERAQQRKATKQEMVLQALQQEIEEQQQLRKEMIEEHRKEMDQLQTKLSGLAVAPEKHIETPKRPIKTGFEERRNQLESLKRELIETRISMEREIEKAKANANAEIMVEKELERGWNRGRPQREQRQLCSDAIVEKVKEDLEKARLERARLVRKLNSSGIKSDLPLREMEARAQTERVRKVFRGLYPGFVSDTGQFVRTPTRSVLCSPAFAQRSVHENFQQLDFQSRVHDDKEWKKVAALLFAASYDELRMKEDWMDWTIASRKEFFAVRVGASLGMKLGIAKSESQGAVLLDRVCFTLRRCENKTSKANGSSRFQIVPEPPLPREIRLQNGLYKRICDEAWEDAKSISVDLSRAGALSKLQELAKEDKASIQNELRRRAISRKRLAERSFHEWKFSKERCRNTMEAKESEEIHDNRRDAIKEEYLAWERKKKREDSARSLFDRFTFERDILSANFIGEELWLKLGTAVKGLHKALDSRTRLQEDWIKFTVHGIMSCLKSPFLRRYSCSCRTEDESNSSQITFENDEGPAEGSLIFLTENPRNIGGFLSPNALVSMLSKEQGVLGTIDGDSKFKVWVSASASCKNFCWAFVIPSLLVKVLMRNSKKTPLLSRLRDTKQFAVCVRELCSNQWERLCPPHFVKWKVLKMADSEMTTREINKFQRMQVSEAFRARVSRKVREIVALRWENALKSPLNQGECITFLNGAEIRHGDRVKLLRHDLMKVAKIAPISQQIELIDEAEASTTKTVRIHFSSLFGAKIHPNLEIPSLESVAESLAIELKSMELSQTPIQKEIGVMEIDPSIIFADVQLVLSTRASPSYVIESKMDKVGTLLKCLSDDDEETFFEAWLNWIVSSKKWEEFQLLGFSINDMDRLARRKWTKFDTNPFKKRTQSYLLNKLGEMLEI